MSLLLYRLLAVISLRIPWAKVVQERLGHSTVSMMLDVYSHVLPSMQQEAAGKIDDLFRHS
jgi:integrase